MESKNKILNKLLPKALANLLFFFSILFFTVGLNLQDNPPPGWYQQTLPVNDFINDIFFLDSLNGWMVTDGDFDPPDTGYILHTTNGGENWTIQLSQTQELNVIQFLDLNNGYAAGGSGHGIDRIFRTSNGGNNWLQLNALGITLIDDMYFINIDTGWICDSHLFGGLYKTTNGGNSWVQQLNENYRPLRVFFIDKDTGWVGTDHSNGRLYRTTNSGVNWSLQYTFPQQIKDIYFFDGNVGIVTSGRNHRTTDGGFTWIMSNDGGIKISMGTDSVGWAGNNFFNIQKTTNQGMTWGRQTSPQFNNSSVSAYDSLIAWAGGSGIVHTTDGGGPITYIKQVSKGIPDKFILYQNYPNPFNPKTIIKFNSKKTSDVSIKVYDISGKLIDGIFYKNVHAGEYHYEFDGTGLTSGVYFYCLSADGKVVDTKKMVFIR